MSKSDLLSSLTADRLKELATLLRTHDTTRSDDDLLAAICHALAKAERAMRGPYGHELCFAMWAGEITVFGPNDPFPFPTLLAALGSVGQQEKHDE